MPKRLHFWGDTTSVTYPPPTKDITTDYLIIGGGIAGLMTAYFLRRHTNAPVTLIEKNTLGSGATGYSAGMLTSEPEQASWHTLTTIYGIPLTRAYFNKQRTVMSILRRLSDKITHPESQDLLLLAQTRASHPDSRKEIHSRKQISSPVDTLDSHQVATELNSPHIQSVLRVGKHLSVNPLALAHTLARQLHKRGVCIFERTPYLDHSKNQARTPHGIIRFKHLILTRGAYEHSPLLRNFLTTIAVTTPLSNTILKRLQLHDHDMFIDDAARSFHYGKITGDNRLLVGFGDIQTETVSYPTPVYRPHVTNIKRFLKLTFPHTPLTVDQAWTAPYALTKTPIPLVKSSRGVLTINGGGTQLASAVAAEYGVSLLLKHPHPLAALFE